MRLTSLIFSLVFLLGSLAAQAETPKQWVDKNLDDVVSLYKQLHSAPELSFEEQESAARMAKELSSLGGEVTTNVGGHGVVALFRNGEGPTLMLRCDMDALPVAEQTGLPYASKVRTKDKRDATVGVMHACGHDIHMANMIGVARYMAANKSDWAGTLMIVCQPAEERGAGAVAMLKDGLFRRFPRPDYALMLHTDSYLQAGKVAYRAGYATANVDMCDIHVKGVGGHGSAPDTTIDPIVIAARLVLDLQTIVSREIKPQEPAVVTVGSIHGGTKHNIIGNECHLQLTMRSYSGKVRQQIRDAIVRKAKAAAESARAETPEVKFTEGSPSMWNDVDLVNQVVGVFEKTLGKENVTEAKPTMGGEDFARYGKAGVPIMMFRVGTIAKQRIEQAKEEGKQLPSLHSPFYYPDPEPSLRTGIVSMSAAALDILAPAGK